LTIFNSESIRKLLTRAGFENIKDQPYRPLCASVFVASDAIVRGADPWRAESLSKEERRAAHKAERYARRDPRVREFITVRAWDAPCDYPGRPRD
jgi:hypothetical protein